MSNVLARLGLAPRRAPQARAFPLAMLGASVASGCAVESTDPGRDTAPHLNLASAREGTGLATQQRFEVAIAATGPFRPHVPIRVTVNVRTLLPTSRTTLRIATPEVELAARQLWRDDFHFDAGQPIRPALTSEPREMAAGASFSESVTLTIRRPGYYRVVARVSSLDDQPLTVRGRLA